MNPMKREEFLKELEYQLRRLPRNERDEAMDYYQGYLDDAGPEQEESVLRALGSPKEVAAQIIREAAAKAVEETDGTAQKQKSSLSRVWIVILAIFASPIALPLAAAAVVVMVAILISIFAVLLSIFLLLIAGGISGMISIFYGIPVLFTTPASGMVVVGVGLALVGVGVIVMLGLAECAEAVVGWVIWLFSRLFKKRAGNER